MSSANDIRTRKRTIRRLEDPPVAQALFGDVRWAWLWLIVRLYVGWQWLSAGWDKLGAATWTGENAGAAITGFVNGALEKTGGAHPDVQPCSWACSPALPPSSAAL